MKRALSIGSKIDDLGGLDGLELAEVWISGNFVRFRRFEKQRLDECIIVSND